MQQAPSASSSWGVAARDALAAALPIMLGYISIGLPCGVMENAVGISPAMAFAISAFMTGLAGGLYTFVRGFISPETFNGTQSTLFMTMLLFGGICTVEGPVIGAIVLLLVKEVFQSLALYQGLVYALFMLIVLFVLPNGIVGIFKSLGGFVSGLKKRNRKEGQANVEN